MPYELKINVKKGVVIGGGLANNAYVEVWIDGMLIETTPSVPSPPEWNKEIIKEFDEIEPLTPIIISLSMYKKRWTSDGYKLVGTTQFPLSDLIERLNKGPIYRMMSLVASKRNITLCGTIQLILELRDTTPLEDNFNRENLLVKKVSSHITKGNNIITKMITILTPNNDINNENINNSMISKLYRYLFHFNNQIFGRFIKLLVLLLWLLIIKYSMNIWENMSHNIEKTEHRINNIELIFQKLLENTV